MLSNGSFKAVPLFIALTAALKAVKETASPVAVKDDIATVSSARISSSLVASRAFLIYPPYHVIPAVANIAMIAITTMSSMSVKPDCLRIYAAKE